MTDYEYNDDDGLTDDELPGSICLTCGAPMEWEHCWNVCDDGIFDMYDEDPLFYDEGDTEVCAGQGGWWVCPVAYLHD